MNLSFLRTTNLAALFIFISLLCFLFLPPKGYTKDVVLVKGVTDQSSDEIVKVAIELSEPAQYTSGRVSNPERLFIDIKNARISNPFKNNFRGSEGVLKGVRIGQFDPNTVRVVLDLSTDKFSFRVIDTKTSPTIFVELYPPLTLDKKNSTTQQRGDFIKRRIVIDPGHGGHDPGAVGYNGLYEKDVVLDIALKVRDIMHREHQNYEIILTRDADFFIPLHKRAEIANRANADMFISIHTNASYNRMAYGVETYILNWTDDEEAMRVAARENAISLKEMKRLRDELSIILASLESEIKRDESIKAAGFIHRSLVSEIPFEYPEFDRGVKQALFYVLVGAKMPSVLLEIGFISNPYEEKMLRNERFRLDIAKSIVSGILNYFSGLPINKTYVVHTTTNSNQKGKAIPLKYSKFKR